MSDSQVPATPRLCKCPVRLGWVLMLAGTLGFTLPARAELLQAPVFGRPIPLGEGRVACVPAVGGWNVENAGHLLRPPTNEDAIGQSVEVKVAPNPAACSESTSMVTLVATDRWPVFDQSSIAFSPDDARLDARGKNLAGVAVSWKTATATGSDQCYDARAEGAFERCAWAVGRDAPADPARISFSWLPNGARSAPDAIIFDAEGRRASPETLALAPARVNITRLVPPDAAVDLATGQGEVPLVHPEAVASAECSPLPCAVSSGKVVVRGAASLVNTIEVRLRLIPHVFLLRKDAADTQLSAKLPVLHCPMSIVSGAPIRNNDDAKLVVKLAGRCGQDLSSVRFVMNEAPVRVLRTLNEQDASYALLQLGDVDQDAITISAVRGEVEGIALAVAHTPTRAAPPVRSTLELPSHPNLGFIPNNRWAIVHVSRAGEHQYFVPLPLEGVYSVKVQPPAPPMIRADPNAAGLAVLQFGLRAEGLPKGLDDVDLAVVTDPLQRGTGEANLPVPLETNLRGPKPLIEMMCGGGQVPLERVQPGDTAHLSYALRDTCRIVFHREWLTPEYGTQKLNFEIDVLRPDGTPRGEAHVFEVVTFRAGSEPRNAYIRGVRDPFDRVVVRVSHVADENHYIGASEIKTGAPAAQWSLVLGTGRARLYATTTIPTGLYRFGDRENSGVLSLNFGVISRLTWLDPEGREGFLGLEAGVLVIGLANSQGPTGRSLTQVGAVVGLGIAVPIANRSTVTQASINLHAWLEADISGASDNRFAFIFGPSISIGNVGTNL